MLAATGHVVLSGHKFERGTVEVEKPIRPMSQRTCAPCPGAQMLSGVCRKHLENITPPGPSLSLPVTNTQDSCESSTSENGAGGRRRGLPTHPVLINVHSGWTIGHLGHKIEITKQPKEAILEEMLILTQGKYTLLIAKTRERRRRSRGGSRVEVWTQPCEDQMVNTQEHREERGD